MMKKIRQKEWSNYNLMRAMLIYDLPSTTKDDAKQYSQFYKNILKLGYTQIQESVYIKCLQSKTISNSHIEKIRKIIPSRGNIRIFVFTEKQYLSGIILSGEVTSNEIVNDQERYKLIDGH